MQFHNSGSVDLDLVVGEIRPNKSWTYIPDPADSKATVLIWPGAPPEAVTGTWSLTAQGVDQEFTGTLSVPVAPPVNITALVEEALASLKD